MGARGDGYRDRALDCEAKAAAETDDKSRRRLLELAKRWRELAIYDGRGRRLTATLNRSF
jgi:hypothetical protein